MAGGYRDAPHLPGVLFQPWNVSNGFFFVTKTEKIFRLLMWNSAFRDLENEDLDDRLGGRHQMRLVPPKPDKKKRARGHDDFSVSLQVSWFRLLSQETTCLEMLLSSNHNQAEHILMPPLGQLVSRTAIWFGQRLTKLKHFRNFLYANSLCQY